MFLSGYVGMRHGGPFLPPGKGWVSLPIFFFYKVAKSNLMLALILYMTEIKKKVFIFSLLWKTLASCSFEEIHPYFDIYGYEAVYSVILLFVLMSM